MAAASGGAYYTRQGKPVIKEKPPAEPQASDFAEIKRREDAERAKKAEKPAKTTPASKDAADKEQ